MFADLVSLAVQIGQPTIPASKLTMRAMVDALAAWGWMFH